MNVNTRPITLILLVLILAVGSLHFVSAQTPEPILIQPTAADFAAHAEAIFANTESRIYVEDTLEIAELHAFFDELDWRFFDTDQVRYAELLTIYRAYAAQFLNDVVSMVSVDVRLMPALVERWLAENSIDMDSVSWIAFDGFEFEVTPFSPPLGVQIVPSYFFRMTAAADQEYYPTLFRVGLMRVGAHLIVIAPEMGVYRVPVLPELVTGSVRDAGDFNADGQADFAYISHSHYGNSYAAGALQIVTWTGDTLEPLTRISFRHGPSDDTPRWQFAQYDDDPQRELLFSQHMGDNWGCALTRLNYFDWNADGALTAQPAIDALPNSFSCMLRRAEEAAWAHDYEVAIPLYEQALALSEVSSIQSVYAQMHLGLAYLLSGRTTEANAAFDALTVPADLAYQLTWVEPIRAAYLRDPRPLPVCQAIYERFDTIFYDTGLTGTVYVTDGGFYGAGWYNPGFNPPNMSCDFAALLESELPSALPLGASALDQIQSMGLPTVDSIAGDFDSDGDQDVLVWVASLGIDPILLRTDADQVTVIYLTAHTRSGTQLYSGELRIPDGDHEYNVVTLPDETVALAERDFGIDQYSNAPYGWSGVGGGIYPVCAASEGFTDSVGGDGRLTLWRLEGDQFVPFFSETICSNWGELIGRFAEVITGTSFIAGEAFFEPEFPEQVIYRPVTYTWDAEMRTFSAPPLPSPTPFVPTPTPTPPPDSLPSYTLQYSTYRQVRAAFAAHDYAATIMMIDAALFTTVSRDPNLETAFRYYRALTLEALARPQEALAQYVNIYEVDPNSAWGILAALHIAPLENG